MSRPLGKPRISLDEIKEMYREGKLDDIREDLASFLEERAGQIRDLMERARDTFPEKDISLSFGVKMYIQQIRSINPENEIQQEMEEIKQEIREQKKKGDTEISRDEIIRQWCEIYAPSWRDNHVLSVIYVFEQEEERYLSLLKEALGEEE